MTNKKLKSIFLIIILTGLFLVPTIIQARLVPCGPNTGIECELCHLFVVLDKIIDFALFNIVFPLATLLLVIGGGMYMLSAGDSSKITKARQILSSTIIGLVIIFSAWLVINTFMTAIGLADWVGPADGWYKIDCPI